MGIAILNMMKVFLCIIFAIVMTLSVAWHSSHLLQHGHKGSVKMSLQGEMLRKLKQTVASAVVGGSLLGLSSPGLADESLSTISRPAISSTIEKVPLYTKRTNEVQQYTDINRGFRLLRPFGFNEFDGAGGGYVVKFASLFDGMKIALLSMI